MVDASSLNRRRAVVDDPLDDFLQKFHLKLFELSNESGQLNRSLNSAADWTASQHLLDEAIAKLGRKLASIRSALGRGVQFERSAPAALPSPTAAQGAQSTLDALQNDAARSAQAALEAWHAALFLIEEAYHSVLVAWSARRNLEEFRNRRGVH